MGCSLQHRSLLYALNDSAPLRQSQSTFTSRVRVLRVRRSGGRAIPRVRCRQQWGSFIHTIGRHSIGRSAQKKTTAAAAAATNGGGLRRPLLWRGAVRLRESAGQGQWRGGVKDVSGRGGWEITAGRDGISPPPVYVNIAR